MSVQAQSADSSFSMLPFMRTEVTPTSITPFLGHYAVSENTSSDQSPTSIHYGHMYPSVSIAQNPEVLVAQAQQEHMVLQNMIQQQQHHQQQHPQQQQRPMIQAPILTQPDPQHFRARQNSIHHHHGQQQQQHFPRGISDDSRVMKRQQSRSKAGSRRASRQATATAEGLELQPLRPAVDKNPPASRGSTSSSKSSAPPPKLELSDDCPEKLRYLLDLRYRFQDGKGKGMWETIHQRWADRYEPKAKEALQMDVNRAVYKYGIWPASEVSNVGDSSHGPAGH